MPVSAAGLVSVMPAESVSEPPSIWIVPAVAVCAALMVRLPAAPISSVWLALFSVIEVAAAWSPCRRSSGRRPCALLIASVRPLTVPVRSSVPLLAVSVPALAIDMLDRAGAGDVGVGGDGAQAADRAAGERDAGRIGQPDAGHVECHRIGANRQRVGDGQGPGPGDFQRSGRAEERNGRGAAGAVELQRVAGAGADPQKRGAW